MVTEDGNEVRTSEEIFPFETGDLPEFFQKKAEIELFETPEKKQKGLKLMREMMQSDKLMANWDHDDDFLLQHLRCRKYDVKRAFAHLKTAFNFFLKNPDIFTDLSFEALSPITRNNIVTFLPKRCQDGCSILLVQLDNWYPEEFPLQKVKRGVMILFLQSLREPMTQVNGYKVIFDAKSNPLRHIRYCTPSVMYLLYHGTQECIAGRFKEIHIVNISFTFKAAWVFLKYIIPKKLRERFFFHYEDGSLLNHFPRSIIPVQYGGDVEDYDMTEWFRKVTQPERLKTIVGKFH